jgi:hypothetical protein
VIDEVQPVPARSAPSSRLTLGRNEHVRRPTRCASLRRTAVPPLYSGDKHSETRMNTGKTERRAVTRNEGVRGSSPRVGFACGEQQREQLQVEMATNRRVHSQLPAALY